MKQTDNTNNGRLQSTYHDRPNSDLQEIQNLKPVLSGAQSAQAEVSEIQNVEGLTAAGLAEIWAQRAYELAKEPPVAATGQTADLLVFWLSGERYSIEVANVREIHPLEQLTPVPRTPDFSVGVFSARGRILSVIDLRAFLGLPTVSSISPSAYGKGKEDLDQTKIIVVTNTDPAAETAGMEVGLLADEVADVTTIFKDDIEPPLTTHAGIRAEYLQGVTSDLMVVLNLNALLNDKRLIIHEDIL